MHTLASAKAGSTLRSSRAVPHPSTNRALRRLTSEVRRDPVRSTRYGRQQQFSATHFFESAAFVATTPALLKVSAAAGSPARAPVVHKACALRYICSIFLPSAQYGYYHLLPLPLRLPLPFPLFLLLLLLLLLRVPLVFSSSASCCGGVHRLHSDRLC